MKNPLTILVYFGAVAVAAGQFQFTYETDAVMLSAGDFATADGRKDLVVLDRASGGVSFGLQNADGSVTWTVPESCGMTAVTGLAVDRFNGGSTDRVAVAAAAANRVTLVSPNPGVTQLFFQHIYPTYPSPKGLAGFDPDGNGSAELFVIGDRLEPAPRYYYEFLGSINSTPVQQWQIAYGTDTTRIHRFVQKTGTAAVVAENFGSQFYVETVGATALTGARLLNGVTVDAATLMTYGTFDGTPYSQVVIYKPGATAASAAKVTEPSTGTYGWGGVTSLSFPKAVRLLTTIPVAGGAARLGIVFMDGTAASYDFDGTNLTLRSTLAGNGFEWLCPIGTDAVIGKNSVGWARFNTNAAGGTLAASSSGVFPNLSVKNKVSNVVFFSGEPFANPDAVPLAQGSVRDWSTFASGAGFSWVVGAAPVSPSGIGNPFSSAFSPSAQATHALVNQYMANVSVRSLEAAAGANVVDLRIEPASGTFRPGDEVALTFFPTSSGYQVRYRVGSGVWINYNVSAPPVISATAVVEAYAYSVSGKSPIRMASYVFSAVPVLAAGTTLDQNANNLGDAWEKAFNITDPAGDADGDGASNLAEYLADTDPRDASSFPSQNGDLVLNATKTVTGGTTTLRLTWDTALGSVLLESSDSLLLGTWTTINSGITTSGGQNVYEVSVPPGGGKRFYRLRRP